MGSPARDVVNMTDEGGVENNGRGKDLKMYDTEYTKSQI